MAYDPHVITALAEEMKMEVQLKMLVEELNARRDSAVAVVVRVANDDSLRIIHHFVASTF